MAILLNGSTGITAPGLETFGDGTALGGATNPIVSMAKAANNYVQGYVVNNTAGASSSADLVAYPDNGTDAHGWVDMGVTSSVYADATYTVTGPNEAYLFGSAPSGAGKTGNLVIATDNTGTANSIQFYTNGFTQAKSAARMTIDGSGTLTVPNIYTNTTASVTYVAVSSTGLLQRGGVSALKYKQDVRDLESIDINKFRSVRYKSKCENDDQTKDHFGFIADEVVEQGLTELVTYGEDGDVEGFQYERMCVVLLKNAQEQQALIQELKAIVDVQAAKIAALEAKA